MKNILVTGGTGMIGVAVKNLLPEANFISSKDYNLLDEVQTEKMFQDLKPEYVLHLAAKVGGVKANYDKLGSFFLENVRINTNVLESSRKYNVKKVISLLSTCVYPDKCEYPLTEEQINNGEPHYTNFAYAYANRMLDVQSRAYRKQYGCNFVTAIPNNLFGENDYFDLEDSHVIPAIIRKIYEAKKNNTSAVFWGDGSPLREFTYSKDVAKVLLFLLENYDEEHPINIGNTLEYSILDVVNYVSDIFNFSGKIIWDDTKLKGQFRKPSSNEKLVNLGLSNKDYTDFEIALKNTCDWFTIKYPNIRGANK